MQRGLPCSGHRRRSVIQHAATEAKARPAPDRILVTALGMADHDYDDFQIRLVAHRAHVSPATLYRHFASKDELLMACLNNWLTDLVPLVCDELTRWDDLGGRVGHAVARITLGIVEKPLLAAAFTRSYLLSNIASPTSDTVHSTLSSLFAHAVGTHRSGPSELLTDIWSVNMPALLQRRITLTELHDRMGHSAAAIGLASAD